MYEATGETHTPPPGIPNRDTIPSYSVGPTDPDRYSPRLWVKGDGPAPTLSEVGNIIIYKAPEAPDKKIETAKKKVPLGTLPLGALSGLARVFQYGAGKYAPGNFIQATIEDGAAERYISAALRHLAQMQHRSGLHSADSLATLDEESGLPHLDHAIASLVMLRAIATKDGVLPADPKEDK